MCPYDRLKIRGGAPWSLRYDLPQGEHRWRHQGYGKKDSAGMVEVLEGTKEAQLTNDCIAARRGGGML